MSAVSPAPLPYPEPDDRDAADAARAPGAQAGPGRLGRPALSVAAPGVVAGAPPSRPDPRPAVRVRLVPPVEPAAAPLRAEGPAHHRPPVLGSPEAVGRPRPLPHGSDETDADRAPDGPLPDPTRLCCAVVQAAVEGLRGARPLAQLTRWVTPEVYDRLALRARLVQDTAPAPSPGRAGIRRVRVCRIGDAAAEATVVVDDGPRVRAVALRVEEHRGRWRATALEIG